MYCLPKVPILWCQEVLEPWGRQCRCPSEAGLLSLLSFMLAETAAGPKLFMAWVCYVQMAESSPHGDVTNIIQKMGKMSFGPCGQKDKM